MKMKGYDSYLKCVDLNVTMNMNKYYCCYPLAEP